MFIAKRWMTGLLAFTMAAGACFAEEPTGPTKFYKLDFVVKEVAGTKILNSRSFMTMVSTGSSSEIRAGGKFPMATSASTYTTIDLGVSIDVKQIKEVQDQLAFFVLAEVASIPDAVPDDKKAPIRQNKWSSSLIVPLKKPTLLFSSENVDTKTALQVEVTATPIL